MFFNRRTNTNYQEVRRSIQLLSKIKNSLHGFIIVEAIFYTSVNLRKYFGPQIFCIIYEL